MTLIFFGVCASANTVNLSFTTKVDGAENPLYDVAWEKPNILGPREITGDGYEITMSNARRPTSTTASIPDMPVSQQGNVVFKLTGEDLQIDAITFTVKQWAAVANNGNLQYSLDGTNFSDFTEPITWSFTTSTTSKILQVTASDLPDGTVAVKLNVLADKSVGISSIEYEYEQAALKPAGFYFTESNVTVRTDGSVNNPLVNPNGISGITYTTSNSNVAYLGAGVNAGVVYVKNPGTTVITATSAEGNGFSAGTASYVLTVIDKDAAIVDLAFTNIGTKGWGKVAADITYETADYKVEFTSFYKPVSGSVISTVPVTKNGSMVFSLKNDMAFKAVTVRFKQWSSNEKKATLQYSADGVNYVDFDPAVTASVKTATTSADFAAMATSIPDGVSYIKVTFNTNESQIAVPSIDYVAYGPLKDAGLSFPEGPYTATIGQSFTAPKLTKATTAAVTYTSSDSEIAAVDATTGAITVGSKKGDVVITATAPANKSYFAGSASYTITVKDELHLAGLAFNPTAVTYTMGEGEFQAPVLSKETPAAVTYVSSNTNVATVNAETGAVTIVAKGTTTITATAPKDEANGYSDGSASYTLTVIDPNFFGVNLSFNQGGVLYGTKWNTTPQERVYENEDYKIVFSYAIQPSLNDAVNDIPVAKGGNVVVSLKKDKTFKTIKFVLKQIDNKTNPATLKYSLDGTTFVDLAPATSSFEVGATSIPYGVTAIQISFASNNSIGISSIEYDASAPLSPAGLSYSEETYEYTHSVGEFTPPTLNNPNELDVKYTSSNTAIANVATDGVVTLVSNKVHGEVTITATAAATATHFGGSASYTMTIYNNLVAPGLSFAQATYEATLGQTFDAPKVDNPNTVSPIVYASSDENVATVDAETGVVTLVGRGTTTISATYAGDEENYNAQTVSYELIVTDPAYAGINLSFVNGVLQSENWAVNDFSNRTYSTDTYTIAFNDFGKSGSTVTDVPVTQNGSVVFSLKEGRHFESVTFNLKQWLATTKTATLEYSTDGTNFKAFDPAVTSGNFVVTVANMPANVVAVKLTFDSSANRVGVASIEYNVTKASLLPSPEISYSEDAYQAIMTEEGEALVGGPELVNPNKVEVELSSSNEDVAIISNGAVILKGIGTTTITATSKITDEFRQGKASYVLTVKAGVGSLEALIEASPNVSTIGFEMTVAYVNGNYIYVYDGTSYSLIVANNTNGYVAGDVIPADWDASYVEVNGLGQIKPDGAMPASTTTAAVPSPVTVTEVSDEMVNQIVVLQDVKFAVATPTSTTLAFNGSAEGGMTYSFLNRFGLASHEAGTYDVKVAVGLNNRGNVQLYPIDIVYNYFPYYKVEWDKVEGEDAVMVTMTFMVEIPDDVLHQIWYKVTPKGGNTPPVVTEVIARAAEDAEAGYTLYTEPFKVDQESTITSYSKVGYRSLQGQTYAGSQVDIDNDDLTTGVENIAVDGEQDVRYFDLNGRPVSNPAPGMYIRIEGGKATKVVVR